MQGLHAAGRLADLGAIAGVDTLFERRGLHGTLLDLVMLDDKLLGVPLDGLQLLLYGRADVLAGAGLAMPESWQGLLRAARRLNGTQAPQLLTTSQPTANSSGPPTYAPGSGPLYGFCLPPSRVALTQVALAVLGSMVQVRGTAQGMYLDRSTLRPAATTVAMPAVLSYLSSLLALGPPGAQFADPAPLFSNDFALGRCAFTIGVAAQFRRNSHAKHPAGPSFVRGLAWASLLPGSDRALSGDTLAACTADTCPYAVRVSQPTEASAANGTAAGSRRRRLTQSSTASSPPSVVPVSEFLISPAFINRAPLLSSLGLLAGVGAGVDLMAQLYSWSMLSALGGPEVSWKLLLSPSSEVGPWRSAHMAAGATAVWEAGGYHPGDTAAFLAACRATLEHPNVVWPLRIRSAPDYINAISAAVASVASNHSLAAEAAEAAQVAGIESLRAALQPLYPLRGMSASGGHSAYSALYTEYQKSFGGSGDNGEAAPGVSPSNRPSPTALAIALVVTVAVVSAAVATVVHCFSTGSPSGAATWRAVEAPQAGPSTCIAVTDIEGSTSLWEALPEVVMDAALRIHHATVRAASLRHGGYESATEGDSFIIAFASPGAAARFALDLQHSLLAASWPTQLLAVPACRPVFARRLEEVARAAQVSLAPGAPPRLGYTDSAGRGVAGVAATAATGTGLSAQQSAWRGHSAAVMALANNRAKAKLPAPKSQRMSLTTLMGGANAASRASRTEVQAAQSNSNPARSGTGRWGAAAARLSVTSGRIAALFSLQRDPEAQQDAAPLPLLARGASASTAVDTPASMPPQPERSGGSALPLPRPSRASGPQPVLDLVASARSNSANGPVADGPARPLPAHSAGSPVGTSGSQAAVAAAQGAMSPVLARAAGGTLAIWQTALRRSFRRATTSIRGGGGFHASGLAMPETSMQETLSGPEEDDRRSEGAGPAPLRRRRSAAFSRFGPVESRDRSRVGSGHGHAPVEFSLLPPMARGARFGGNVPAGSGGGGMSALWAATGVRNADSGSSSVPLPQPDPGWILAAARQSLMPASDMAAVADIRAGCAGQAHAQARRVSNTTSQLPQLRTPHTPGGTSRQSSLHQDTTATTPAMGTSGSSLPALMLYSSEGEADGGPYDGTSPRPVPALVQGPMRRDCAERPRASGTDPIAVPGTDSPQLSSQIVSESAPARGPACDVAVIAANAGGVVISLSALEPTLEDAPRNSACPWQHSGSPVIQEVSIRGGGSTHSSSGIGITSSTGRTSLQDVGTGVHNGQQRRLQQRLVSGPGHVIARSPLSAGADGGDGRPAMSALAAGLAATAGQISPSVSREPSARATGPPPLLTMVSRRQSTGEPLTGGGAYYPGSASVTNPAPAAVPSSSNDAASGLQRRFAELAAEMGSPTGRSGGIFGAWGANSSRLHGTASAAVPQSPAGPQSAAATPLVMAMAGLLRRASARMNIGHSSGGPDAFAQASSKAANPSRLPPGHRYHPQQPQSHSQVLVRSSLQRPPEGSRLRDMGSAPDTLSTFPQAPSPLPLGGPAPVKRSATGPPRHSSLTMSAEQHDHHSLSSLCTGGTSRSAAQLSEAVPLHQCVRVSDRLLLRREAGSRGRDELHGLPRPSALELEIRRWSTSQEQAPSAAASHRPRVSDVREEDDSLGLDAAQAQPLSTQYAGAQDDTRQLELLLQPTAVMISAAKDSVLPARPAAARRTASRPLIPGSLLDLVHRLYTPVEGPGQAGEAALLFAGLRVRVGMHCGVTDPRDVQYNSATARITYSGEGLRLAKAVCDCASGGQVVLSGEVLCALQQGGEGGPHGALLMDLGDHQLFEAQPAVAQRAPLAPTPSRTLGRAFIPWGSVRPPETWDEQPAPSAPPPALPVSRHLLQLAAPALLGRLRLMPPLRSAIHQFTPGCMDAPVGAAVAVVAIRVVAADSLLSWSAAAAAESVALLELFLRASLGPLLQQQGQAAAEAAAPGTAPPSTEGQQAAGDSAAAAAPVDSPAVACYLAAAGPGSPFGTFIVGFSRPATAARWALQAAGRMAQLPWPEPLLDSPWGRPLLGVPRAQAEAEAEADTGQDWAVPAAIPSHDGGMRVQAVHSVNSTNCARPSTVASELFSGSEARATSGAVEAGEYGTAGGEEVGQVARLLTSPCTQDGNSTRTSCNEDSGASGLVHPATLRLAAAITAADRREEARPPSPGSQSAYSRFAQNPLRLMAGGRAAMDMLSKRHASEPRLAGRPDRPRSRTHMAAGADPHTSDNGGAGSSRKGLPGTSHPSEISLAGMVESDGAPPVSASSNARPDRGPVERAPRPGLAALPLVPSPLSFAYPRQLPDDVTRSPSGRKDKLVSHPAPGAGPSGRTSMDGSALAPSLASPRAGRWRESLQQQQGGGRSPARSRLRGLTREATDGLCVEASAESGATLRAGLGTLQKLTASISSMAHRLQPGSSSRRAARRGVGASENARGFGWAASKALKDTAADATDAEADAAAEAEAQAEDFEPLSLRGLRVRMGLDVGRVRVELCPLTGRLVYGGKTVTAAMTAAAAARLGMLYVTREAAEAMREEEAAAAQQGQRGHGGIASGIQQGGMLSSREGEGPSWVGAPPETGGIRGGGGNGGGAVRLVCMPVLAVRTVTSGGGGTKAVKLNARNPPLRCRLLEESDVLQPAVSGANAGGWGGAASHQAGQPWSPSQQCEIQP